MRRSAGEFRRSTSVRFAMVVGATGLLAAAAVADEPGWLGRILRRNAAPAASPRRVTPAMSRDRTSAGLLEPPSIEERAEVPTTPARPAASLVPPPANADPLVSRFAVGRATDGSTFGVFLHLYADGTVMDSSGLHHSDPGQLEILRGVLEDLPLDELDHHYPGAAAGDLEVIQMIVYQRSKGRIRAVSFSYSGDPGDAPPAIRRLHSALESFQMHLAGAGGLITNSGLGASRGGTAEVLPSIGDAAPPPPAIVSPR